MGCVFLFENTQLKNHQIGFLFFKFIIKHRCFMETTNVLIIWYLKYYIVPCQKMTRN